MTQTFRSRDEQVADLTNQFGEEGTFSFVDDRDAATQHILEAEARGAAEERGRVEETPSAYVRPDDFYRDEGDERFGPWSSEQSGKCTIPLYTYPANVAALEAEIEGLRITLAHSDGVRNEKQKRITALKARIAELEGALRRIVARAAEDTATISDYEGAALARTALASAPNPIQTMTDDQLSARLRVVAAQWDEIMGSDEELGGGSPLEGLYEEMQSLQSEIVRRAAFTREGGV